MSLARAHLDKSGIRIIGTMGLSVRLVVIPIPECLDFIPYILLLGAEQVE